MIWMWDTEASMRCWWVSVRWEWIRTVRIRCTWFGVLEKRESGCTIANIV